MAVFKYIADAKSNHKLLIRDALTEFCNARTPAFEYVARRYRNLSDDFKEKKQADVEQRLKEARQMVATLRHYKTDFKASISKSYDCNSFEEMADMVDELREAFLFRVNSAGLSNKAEHNMVKALAHLDLACQDLKLAQLEQAEATAAGRMY